MPEDDVQCENCNDYGCEQCDDTVSPTEVRHRALRAFGGNHELAREAAAMYPGEFI